MATHDRSNRSWRFILPTESGYDMRVWLLRLVLVLGLVLGRFVGIATAAEPTPPPARPNVLILLADDLGWGDLACYGHPRIRTPYLDRLATQGTRFTQCYAACSVCSPSRSAILTGRTPYRNGVFRWIPEGSDVHLRTSEQTAPQLLRAAGYQTAHIGKWHLNGRFNDPAQPQPGDHGYDYWLATQNNAAPSHKNPNNFVRNGQPTGELTGFSADLCATEAITWLKQRSVRPPAPPAASPPAAPFFLTVWFHEPHLPIESDPKHQAVYAELSDPDLKQHYGNVSQLDAAVGRILQALEDLQLTNSTLVVFTSDNGPEGNGTTGRTRGSTGGLRGRKRSSYEGGIRVPGIIRYPGVVPAGRTDATPIVGTDLFPTVLDLAGVPRPADRVLDGISLLPLWRGEAITRARPLYWRNHLAPWASRVAYRDGDWKLIAADDLSQVELYHLKQDPQEQDNRAAVETAIRDRLWQQLKLDNAAILAEGPDWWKTDTSSPPKPKAKKP